MRRKQWAKWGGLAGMVGGLLWAAQSAVRTVAFEHSVYGLTYEQLGMASFVPDLLVLFALQGYHALQRGRASKLERAGHAIACTGLVLAIAGSVVENWLTAGIRQPGAVGAVLARLLALLGRLILAPGLLLLGTATLRARVLPRWLAALPLALGATLAGGFVLSLLIRSNSTGYGIGVALAVGLAWTAIGAGVWQFRNATAFWEAQAREEQQATPSLGEVWQSFVSWGTVLSGAAAVAVWSLEWNWTVGLLVVLLLYAHEIGHALAALWRGITVRRAPFFLPGFGAFVTTAPRERSWDDIWISLGGPLVGGAAALAVKAAGSRGGHPALAHAGDFALIVNVVNLLPFSMLDGGKVAARTGWLGFVLTLALGGLLLFQGMGLFLSLLIVLGIAQAFRASRARSDIGWGGRVGAMALYLTVFVALLLMLVLSGRVPWLPSGRPTWMPSAADLFTVVFWIYLAGAVALPVAWRSDQTARTRYVVAALLGWPRYLLGKPRMIPIVTLLAAHTLGAPGLIWLRSLTVRWSASASPAGGSAAAYAFDCLRREDRGDAEEWLGELTPALVRGGSAALGDCYQTLVALGYRTTANDWLRRTIAAHGPLVSLPPWVANSYAWDRLTRRRAVDALDYARAAVAAEPENATYLDTLGQTLFASGQPAEAAAMLRRSLAHQDRTGTRVALARAQAAQGQYEAAIAGAEAALSHKDATWPDDEPSVEQVHTWVREWRVTALAEGTVQAEPVSEPIPD